MRTVTLNVPCLLAWAVGMPDADLSHLICTRALAGKPDPVTTTSVPTGAAVGAMAIVGVAA